MRDETGSPPPMNRPVSPAAPRTLSIGGATYDVFVRTGQQSSTDGDRKILALPLGEKIRVQQVIETCGGGAANTAVGLARLGCAAHFAGILGSDQWGQRQLENFRNEGVDACTATIVDDETSSFSIILSSETGERVILYDPGTNAHLHDANFDREQAATMQWIYLNHLYERSRMIEDDLVALLTAHPAMGLTWNPGGSQIKSGLTDKNTIALLKVTRFLICNKEEALEFSGEATVEDALRSFVQHGVAMACVCDGKNGAMASEGKKLYHCPVLPHATIVDTTGAGDAFGSGATWALVHGYDLPTALRAGTIHATSVIAAVGAQAGLLTDIEMQARLKKATLDVVEIDA